MSSRPSVSKRLKALAKEIPDDEMTHFLLSGLEHIEMSDHAVATMGATLIDKALEVAILSRLIPMSDDDRKRLFDYDHGGPLCDLSARIIVGKSLGLYGSDTTEDLTRIREIRNAFAHSLWLIKFETKEVAAMCEFHISRHMGGLPGEGPKARIFREMSGGIMSFDPGTTPRSKYLRAARFIAFVLKNRIKLPGLAAAHFPPPDLRLS